MNRRRSWFRCKGTSHSRPRIFYLIFLSWKMVDCCYRSQRLSCGDWWCRKTWDSIRSSPQRRTKQRILRLYWGHLEIETIGSWGWVSNLWQSRWLVWKGRTVLGWTNWGQSWWDMEIVQKRARMLLWLFCNRSDWWGVLIVVLRMTPERWRTALLWSWSVRSLQCLCS